MSSRDTFRVLALRTGYLRVYNNNVMKTILVPAAGTQYTPQMCGHNQFRSSSVAEYEHRKENAVDK